MSAFSGHREEIHHMYSSKQIQKSSAAVQLFHPASIAEDCCYFKELMSVKHFFVEVWSYLSYRRQQIKTNKNKN